MATRPKTNLNPNQLWPEPADPTIINESLFPHSSFWTLNEIRIVECRVPIFLSHKFLKTTQQSPLHTASRFHFYWQSWVFHKLPLFCFWAVGTLGSSRIDLIRCSNSTLTVSNSCCCCSGQLRRWWVCASFKAATKALEIGGSMPEFWFWAVGRCSRARWSKALKLGTEVGEKSFGGILYRLDGDNRWGTTREWRQHEAALFGRGCDG